MDVPSAILQFSSPPKEAELLKKLHLSRRSLSVRPIDIESRCRSKVEKIGIRHESFAVAAARFVRPDTVCGGVQRGLRKSHQ
jgi:hypothetical protein